MVGCVVVHHGQIVGEGWHQQFGGPHAEVHALTNVIDASILPEATVYVTLEPCSYHGKTPACSTLLIDKRVNKVVAAMYDPNPKVAGSGMRALQEAGITTKTGLLEAQAMALNKRFLVNQALQRPYILLKWAQTADGFLARPNNSSKWISSPESRQLVHQWRANEDAILVGKNTAMHDNPALTVRHWQGNNPVRVVLDRQLSLPPDLQLFNSEAPTLIYNQLKNQLLDTNEFICLPTADFLPQVMAGLYKKNIGSVLVEGGAQVLASLLKLGLWDEARVFTSPQTFKEGVSAPLLAQQPTKQTTVGVDQLSYYYNKNTIKHWQKNSH